MFRWVCPLYAPERREVAVRSAGRAADQQHAEEDQHDHQRAEERAGIVSAVDVLVAQRKDDQQNKADQRDRKQKRVAEIRPRGQRPELLRAVITIFVGHSFKPLSLLIINCEYQRITKPNIARCNVNL